MEFSRQEYWSGLLCPSPGCLPDPGMEPGSPALQADSLPSEPPGKLGFVVQCLQVICSLQASASEVLDEDSNVYPSTSEDSVKSFSTHNLSTTSSISITPQSHSVFSSFTFLPPFFPFPFLKKKSQMLRVCVKFLFPSLLTNSKRGMFLYLSMICWPLLRTSRTKYTFCSKIS